MKKRCELCELKPLTLLHYADDVIVICDCLTCGTPMLVFRRHGDISLAEEHHARQKLIELYGKRLVKMRTQARKIKTHRHWHLLLEEGR